MITEILNLYQVIQNQKKLDNNYAVVFIFNGENSIRDSLHSSECVTEQELNMIVESFRKSVQFVYSINGELLFISEIERLRIKHKYIFVYSMAQNLNGVGRRSLIPLICDYFELINIGSDFLASTLGGTKQIMFNLLKNKDNLVFPYTAYITNTLDIYNCAQLLSTGEYIIKPNDESASIGVKVIKFDELRQEDFIEQLANYQKIYSKFSVQEFIKGDEVEVSLLFLNNQYHCPEICKIKNEHVCGFLNYDIVKSEGYDFGEYDSKINLKIIEASIIVAKTLGFSSISRIDFRVRNNKAFIIDIGPNPTISFHSSTNYMFRKYLNNDETSIYRLILYKYLIENGLFEPPFN